jgi:transposase
MTSIEPRRTQAYSSDIGLRIVWQRAGMGMSFQDIAARLQIGVGTAHKLWKRFVDLGGVSPLKRSPRPETRKLDGMHEIFIIALLHENPTLYLQEICAKIAEVTNVIVSAPTVCRVLHRNGLTRKRLRQVAMQRSASYRGDFMAEIILFIAHQADIILFIAHQEGKTYSFFFPNQVTKL